MIDLTTSYLGFRLRSPLVASSSPLCKDIGKLQQIEDAGAGAVVLHSLFEEQIVLEGNALDRFLTEGSDSHAEALSYFPDLQSYNIGPDGYLRHIEHAKRVLNIPLIASLNGISTGGWVKYAKLIEQAGADALELNIYFLPTRADLSAGELEKSYVELARDIRSQVTIPVAVKLGPFFTAFADFARRLDQTGVNALVIFNRFYQPDFNLETLEVEPSLHLSTRDDLRLRLHWTALLFGNLKAQLAITGGINSAEDAVKGIMAGAQVVMTTSALLRYGIGYLAALEANLREWMQEHEYDSIDQMRGAMSAARVAEPAAFARANYIKVLSGYTLSSRAHT